MKPFVKSMAPSPPLFFQENAFEKYQFSNNSGKIYICVFGVYISSSVSDGADKCCSV
jgi:hypothetical protein